MNPTPPTRIVHCEDALAWLSSRTTLEGCSLVASLPDISEFPESTLAEWKSWFTATARLVLARCPKEGVTFFYQSDIKIAGTWVDKAYLCQRAAESLGHELLFHRIVCRVPAGTATFGRPSYSHLLAFSEGVRINGDANAQVDVMRETGDKTWQRGMGLSTCRSVAQFVLDHTATRTLVNPFCGEGSLLAAANSLGLNAIGIERSPKRAEKSRRLAVTPDGRGYRVNASP